MQHLVWQRWLESGGASAPSWSRCWRACRPGARSWGSPRCCGIFFVIAGGLSPRVALLGLAAAAVWAALWPSEATGRVARAGAVGQPALGDDGHGTWWSTPCRSRPSCSTAPATSCMPTAWPRTCSEPVGAAGTWPPMSRDPELLDGGRPGARHRRDGGRRAARARARRAAVAGDGRPARGLAVRGRRPLPPHLVSRPERAGSPRQDARRLRRQRQP